MNVTEFVSWYTRRFGRAPSARTLAAWLAGRAPGWPTPDHPLPLDRGALR
jgi:hypothetical protein